MDNKQVQEIIIEKIEEKVRVGYCE